MDTWGLGCMDLQPISTLSLSSYQSIASTKAGQKRIMTCSYSTPSQSDIDNHLLVFDIKAYTRLRHISLSTTKTRAVNCSLSFIQATGTVTCIRTRI